MSKTLTAINLRTRGPAGAKSAAGHPFSRVFSGPQLYSPTLRRQRAASPGINPFRLDKKAALRPRAAAPAL